MPDLSDFGAGVPSGDCPHENTDEWPVPSPRHVDGDHDWAGKHPVWCRDCHDFVDRVAPSA